MNEDTKWLRDEYALESFKFLIKKYFDKDFELMATDCELEIHELLASLCYMLADEMVKQR